MIATIKNLLRERRRTYRPPPDLTVGGWAEKYRFLSSEASAEAGKWHNARNPMLVQPMDALSPQDPCERVVCKFSSQVGKTEIGLNFGGYQIDQDPGPMLIVQPTKMPMGETFAKDRIGPMLRDTPVLAKIFGGKKAKDHGNTIYHKVYPGGQMTVAGANSPSQLASRPIRYLYCDELDRWVVTKEGNALLQARARMKSFHNKKELLTSSPSFPNVGIDFEYQQCLQHEWQLKCQHCDHQQFPKFKNFIFDRDEFGKAINVQFVCSECGSTHGEQEEGFLKATAEWVIVNDADPKFKGYWANQFGSSFVAWRDTVQEFLDAKDDPERLQVVVNTAFAECWEGVGEKLEPQALYDRREQYPVSRDGELLVPNEADQLFMTVDTQDTWLDCEVFAVNAKHQSWGMLRTQLYGDTSEDGPYEQLDELLATQFPTEDGGTMSIYATMMDIKGHRQKKVVEYLHDRKFLKIYGYAGQKDGAKNQIARAKKRLEDGTKKWVWIFNVRTNDFKRAAMTFMGRESHRGGACHWPKGASDEDVAGYDLEHFEQACAEKMNSRMVRGTMVTSFDQTRKRNEAFDLRHMLYALLQISKPSWSRHRNEKPSTRLIKAREKAAAPIAGKKDAPVKTRKRKRMPVIEGAEFIKSKTTKRSTSNWITKRR